MEEVYIKPLKHVARLIASGKEKAICHALNMHYSDLITDIIYCKEFTAFDPQVNHSLFGYYWWGIYTMGLYEDSEECRNARLLGIAFMLTMPEDMVPE